MMALVGFCSQAGAQALCPELTRLRGEAAAASEKVRGFPTSDRCAAYVRFSMAWDAVIHTPMTIARRVTSPTSRSTTSRNNTARRLKRVKMSARAALLARIQQKSFDAETPGPGYRKSRDRPALLTGLVLQSVNR
jgi:hypothetical protein